MPGTRPTEPASAVRRPPGGERFTAFDGLRGLAAVLVIWFHLGTMHWTHGPPLGFLAVDLFFLLSGFVLAHRYDAHFASGGSPGMFMTLRAVRLYPLYFAGFLLGAVLA